MPSGTNPAETVTLPRAILLSVASSMVWALFAYELVGTTAREKAIWGGVLASPLIGVILGLSIGRLRLRSRIGRAFLSLLGLYAATFLFGLAVGICDLATGQNSGPGWHRVPGAVILQSGIGMVWGLTFTGYVLFLWPLSYLNFWLLWHERSAPARPREVVEQLHRARPYSEALLASPALDPNAEWWAAGSRERLPWAGTWRGKAGIEEFFGVLNREMDYQRFEAEELIAEGDIIIAVVHAAGRSIRTGRAFESHIVREYSFRGGRIVRVRNFYDTAAYERSLDPESFNERE